MEHQHSSSINNFFTDNFASSAEAVNRLRERILADARAARAELHDQVDQILLVATETEATSAEAAITAFNLSKSNLVLQNLLYLNQKLRKSCSSFEEPLSLDMIVPLFSYLDLEQQQPNDNNQQVDVSSKKDSINDSPRSTTSTIFISSGSDSSSPSSPSASETSTITADSPSPLDLTNEMNNSSFQYSPPSLGYITADDEEDGYSLPLDLSVNKSRVSSQQQKFPASKMKAQPKMKIKNKDKENFYSADSPSPLAKHSSLPLKKRKYAEMVSTETQKPSNTRNSESSFYSTDSQEGQVEVKVKVEPGTVLQDETINNFARANRKENMVTVQRKCLVDDCELFFPNKPSMHAHMAEVHGVLQFACNVIDCGCSYVNQQKLTAHLTSVHANMTSFGCPKCLKPFKRYEQMAHHIYAEHAVGVFACAISGCDFSGSTRAQVSRHFEKCHRKYVCAQCGRAFTYTGHLRTHERTHLRVKPYSCAWDGCSYVTENKSHAISHIRIRHFKLPPTRKLQAALDIQDNRDPNEYLVIDHDLIAQTRAVFAAQRSSIKIE